MKREKDEVTRTNAKLEGQIRALDRKSRDVMRDLTRYKDESHSKVADHKRLENLLNEAREQYRSKLLSYLGEEAMAAKLAGEEISKFIDGDKSGDNNGKDKSTSASMTEANSRAALEDLIRTYKEREKDLLALNEKIKRQADENLQKNRLLYSSFFKVKDALEDATDGQVKVEDLPKEDEMKVTESQLQKERDEELMALRQAVAQLRSDSAIQKDRAVEVSQVYRETNTQQEKKLESLASKMSLLQAENDRLIKERDEQKDEKTLKTLETNMEDMQRNILEQIQNVKIEAPKYEPKKRGAPEDTAPQGSNAGTSEADRRELQALRNKLRKYKSESNDTAKYRQENLSLKEEIQKMKIQKIEARASSSSAAGPSETTGVASVELQKQLHESELEKHKLSTKVTMLTEELENYKNYMKSTVVKYKREIEGLKKMAAVASS